MRRIVGDAWFYPVLFAAAGVFFVAWGWTRGNIPTMVSGLAMFFFVWQFLPMVRLRSRPMAEAELHVAAGGVVVFWRPGCKYCMKLVLELSPRQREAACWVNIWTDQDAAAALRRLHALRQGEEHEAVPTAWARTTDFIVADEESRARLKDMLGPAD